MAWRGWPREHLGGAAIASGGLAIGSVLELCSYSEAMAPSSLPPRTMLSALLKSHGLASRALPLPPT